MGLSEQNALRLSDKLDEIVLLGAMTCSKMRPEAFGGFVERVTATDVQSGTTADLLDQMRQESSPVTIQLDSSKP